MIRSELLAAAYRQQADQATAAAEASPLPEVRRKFEHAAGVWLDLAAMEDRRTVHSKNLAARLLAEAARVAAAPSKGDLACMS